jgi:hypothetical protein
MAVAAMNGLLDAMQAVEFAGKNGDFAGERQFADAGTQ